MSISYGATRSNQQKKFHFDNIYMDNPRPYESIILYQIGDLSCEGGYVIGDHVQCCYEVSYIVSGRGHYYSNGRSYYVKKGDVFLSLPGEHHDGKADLIDPFRFFYIGFNFQGCFTDHDPFSKIVKKLDQVQNPLIADKFDIQTPFVNTFTELINLKDYSNIMIKTYLHQIVLLAYRNFYDYCEIEYSPHNTIDNIKQIVYEVINYIDVNLCKIVELSKISEEFDYSYTYLSHIFSRETGLSIQEYYNKKRFEVALKWLKDSDLSITQIAEKLQYQSIHSFSRAFKQYFNLSPTEYQSLQGKKQKVFAANENYMNQSTVLK